MELETVKAGIFRQVIKTSGQILSSQDDEVIVVSTATGIVSFPGSIIVPGSVVKSGDAILSVSSQKLPDGDPAAKAKIVYETALQEYQRARNLVEDRIISQKDFEQVRLRYELAKTAYESQASSYSADGINVRSPFGGFIKDLFVSQGDFVSVGEPIAIVAQNKKLQLRAEVPESMFKMITSVNDANFKLAYDDTLYKLSDLNGRLLSFGRASGRQSHFIPITFIFDNLVDLLPDSFAEVYLISTDTENVVSLPVSAITEEQELHFVYVKQHEEEYKKQEVSLGFSDGDRIQIISGLQEGDEVVTKGVYQVRLAATASIIPEGHVH